MQKVAVILSGCGVFDGAEIHEAVFSLLCIEQQGASYQCFAPDVAQMHVINHLTGEVSEDTRNVLVESARIARGNVLPVTACNVDEFDALIVPGGFGVAKNLCTFAVEGSQCTFNPDVVAVGKAFAKAAKPAGYACIAPVLAAGIYPAGVKLTIGNDADTAANIEGLSATHMDCRVNEVIIDGDAKLVTTPAYMLAQNISEAYASISAMVKAVFSLSKG